jgi:uncharacterized protein YjbI with pentapeptide repeats
MMKKPLLLLFSLGFIGTISSGGVDNNILKLKAVGSCVNCNFTGANLSGLNLSKTDLSKANLNNVKHFDKVILCDTLTPWGIDDSGC